MKKIFFMLALAFLQVCYSQNEGRFILTGDLNFNKRAFDHYEFDSDEETTFSTSIKAGYILLDSNLEIGLGFAFSSSNDNFSDENFEVISALIYANQYFPLTDRFALNISGEFSYSKSYYRDRDDFDQKTYILEFRPGCIYFVSKRIGLTANYGSVGFNTSKFRQTSGDSSINNIYFNFNPSSIRLGLAFLL
jgi:hypothetical protein